MKILMIIPSVSKKWGGTTTSLLNFYTGLSQHSNIACSIVTTVSADEEKEISTEILDNEDFRLFPTKSVGWRYSKELKEYLKENIKNFDLVWVHALWTGTTYYAAKYAKQYNVPYIVTPHGMIEPDAMKRKGLKKKLYWSLIEKKVFDNAAAIHCITEAESSYAKQLTKTKNFVIPNGIEEEPFLFKDDYGSKTICFIGRFHEKKALDLLLKAMVIVDDIHLLVAGGGEQEYETYIETLVEELGLNERVTFKGFADKAVKKEMFSKSSFLVLPSHTEGLSMVGLEAVMHSTPVLTTRKCNFDEVEQFNAGLVMEDNDPETIANYIEKMLKSDLEQMSKNAHALAMEKFSIVSVSSIIYEEFKKITNEKN